MPSYKTHILIGFAGLILIFLANTKLNLFTIPFGVLFLSSPIILIYSILPDLDSGISEIRQWIQPLFLTASAGLIIYYYVVNDTRALIISISLIAIMIIISFSSHRQHFHNIFASLILSLPVIYLWYSYDISWFYPFIAIISYNLHLLADGTLLKGGVF